LEFRRPMKTSPMLEEFVESYRKHVSFVEDDVLMYELMHESQGFLQSIP
jgi:histidine ammonia-lyase